MKKNTKKPNKEKGFFESLETVIFSWESPEYLQYQKSGWWFAGASLIVLGLIIYGIYSDAWTFSIALLLVSGVYYLLYHKEPKNLPIKILRSGVQIGPHKLSYQHIRYFWIHEDPHLGNILYLQPSSRFALRITLSLVDQESSAIREYLASQIPELPGKREHFSDTLVRLLKL